MLLLWSAASFITHFCKTCRRFDYHTSVVAGQPVEQTGRLQISRFQNSAARLVLEKRDRDLIASLLKKLHWPPVQFFYEYKVRNLRTVTSTVHCRLISHRRSAHIKHISSIMYPPILKRETFRFPKRNLKFLRHRSFHFIVLFLWNFLPVSLKFPYFGCNLNLTSRLSCVDRPHKPR